MQEMQKAALLNELLNTDYMKDDRELNFTDAYCQDEESYQNQQEGGVICTRLRTY